MIVRTVEMNKKIKISSHFNECDTMLICPGADICQGQAGKTIRNRFLSFQNFFSEWLDVDSKVSTAPNSESHTTYTYLHLGSTRKAVLLE